MKIPRVSIYALILLSFAAAAGYGYFKIERILDDAALLRRRDVATLAAAVLEERFERLEDLGSSLSTRVRFGELVERRRWQDAIKILRSVPTSFPFIDRVLLTDDEGTLVAHVPALPGVIGKNFAFHDWYRATRATGKPTISEVYRRQALPRYDVVAVALPVRGNSGAVRGILVLQVRASTVFDWIEAVFADTDVNLEIVDQKGHLVALQHPSNRGDRPNVDELPKADAAGSVAVPLPRYGWSVVARQSAIPPVRRHALEVLLSIYATLLLLTLALARALVRAFEALESSEAELARVRGHASS